MDLQVAQQDILANKLSLWKERLIDFGHMNKLLYFGTGKGYAEVPAELSSMIVTLFSNEKKSAVIKPDLMDERLLKRIERKARENAEERGLSTLNIAIGLLECENPAEQDTICAPVILVPVHLENRTIEVIGDPLINPILIAFLSRQEVLSESEDWVYPGAKSIESLIDSWTQSLPSTFVFTIEPRILIGNFWFQGMEMALDLEAHQEDLLSHEITRALIGDEEARIALNQERKPVDPHTLDRRPSQTDFLILDADSSQQQVIAAVEQGQSGVIQGPPGTGKSQTLANIIATMIANTKTVLFIAEKKAAIDVIEERLRGCGLDHLCMNLHGMQLSRKAVLEHIRKAIAHAQDYARAEIALQPYEDLDQRRSDLNQHVQRLHDRREGPGMNLYALWEFVHSHKEYGSPPVQWTRQHLNRWDERVRKQIENDFKELCDVENEIHRSHQRILLPPSGQARIALKNAFSWISQYGKFWYEGVCKLCSDLALKIPTTLQETVGLMEWLTRQCQVQRAAPADIYNINLAQLYQVISANQTSGWFEHYKKLIFDSAFRSAWQELARFFPQQPPRLMATLTAQAVAVQQWYLQQGITSVPTLVQTQIDTIDYWPKIAPAFHTAGFTQSEQSTLSLDEIIAQGKGALEQIDLLEHHEAILQRLYEAGLADLLRWLQQSKIPLEKRYEFFLYAWSKSWIAVFEAEDPAIVRRYASIQERAVTEFQQSDQAIFHINASRINQRHAEHCLEVLRTYAHEESYLRKFFTRVRKLPSLTTILQNAPHVMQALFPCIMASPLVVSQMLKVAPKYFDLVLVDEASQILPEHAMMAIMRGKQIAVAGDRHQLPPTTFFVSQTDGEGSEIEDEEDETGAYESLLDLMSGIVSMEWYLQWHYRSRDEKLIAFSNNFIYDNKLVTFPGTSTVPAVQLKLVTAREGSKKGSPEEIQAVLDLIKTFAYDHPNESLGVITLGIAYAYELQQALDLFSKSDEAVAHYCDEARSPRFFIKSIEQVQGDERDHIILAVGYGKIGGRMRYLFGPINQKGGERRLNVAVTRARLTMTVVSSFTHLDMAPDKTDHSAGLRFLRQYLAYANSNGKDLQQPQLSHKEMNVFERDIYEKLRGCGIQLEPQVGVSNYYIDFAVMHPERPGEYLMALECDGARYHSSQTARDRDRLRQQVLENLGWRFHRIWSTDWFYRQEKEIERFMQHYKACLVDSHTSSTISHSAPVQHQSPVKARPPKPDWIGKGGTISQYQDDEIIAILQWIESDKRARLDEELKQELMEALGFSRRTAKMNEVFSRCIERYHKLQRAGRSGTKGR